MPIVDSHSGGDKEAIFRAMEAIMPKMALLQRHLVKSLVSFSGRFVAKQISVVKGSLPLGASAINGTCAYCDPAVLFMR